MVYDLVSAAKGTTCVDNRPRYLSSDPEVNSRSKIKVMTYTQFKLASIAQALDNISEHIVVVRECPITATAFDETGLSHLAVLDSVIDIQGKSYTSLLM